MVESDVIDLNKITGIYGWLMVALLTNACKENDKQIPCPAIMVQPGVRFKILDSASRQNLIYKADSFEWSNKNGNVFFIPDLSDSSIFVETKGDSVETCFFRIKPSTQTDTLRIYARLYEKPDDPCKTMIYQTDSITQNGKRINSNTIFY